MSDAVHSYATRLAWTGSTGVGYEGYDRAHDVASAPAEHGLRLASDPAFGGDPALLNPEQLVVAAASSCQLLSFLAVAARARLDVVDYLDDASATMSEAQRPMRLDEIALRPHITLSDTARARPTDARLEHLVEVAHRECFIANSLSTPVRVEPTFAWR